MTFSSWILSITGVTILSVVLDLFLPDGKTNSLIKSIFSYVIIFIIVMPLPTLLKGDYSIDQIFSTEEIEIQDEYIYQLNKNKLIALENMIEDSVLQQGLEGIDVSISADIFTYDMQINAIFVNLFDLVIKEENKHIDIETTVIECIQEHLQIKKEKIIFND